MSNTHADRVYRQLDASQWQRIFLVGDLHGCYDQLMSKLQRVKFQPQTDLLVSVGDLIDRGAKNLECLALLEEEWFCAVRGNHEQMAIQALKTSDSYLWLANGGSWYLALDPERRRRADALIGRCEQLPLVIDIQLPQRHVVIAHADYPLNEYRYGQAVDEEALLWSRQRINHNQRGKGAPIAGATHFFFGHTPLDRVRHFFNQFYIDTGAVFGGSLTVIELNSLPV